MQQASGSQMNEALIRKRHWIFVLLEKENGVASVDLIGSPDRLLHEREVSPCQSSCHTPGPHRTGNIATHFRYWTRRSHRIEKRAGRWIMSHGDELVYRWSVKNAKARLPHEPEMKRSDIGIAGE